MRSESLIKVLGLPDPDALGSSEYRALCDLFESALADGDGEEMVLAICDEMIEHCQVVKKKLEAEHPDHKQADWESSGVDMLYWDWVDKRIAVMAILKERMAYKNLESVYQREATVRVLEEHGIQCYDHETLEQLLEDLIANIVDETIDLEMVFNTL